MILFLLGLFGVSFSLTGGLRYTTTLDIPNERSSHTKPVVKGGGLAFVMCFLGGVSASHYFYTAPMTLTQALWCMGLATASIGYWDDRSNVAAGWRLLLQLLTVVVVSQLLGNFPILWAIFSSLVLLSLINIFNFLDGIDGYAATEAIVVATMMAYISWLDGLKEVAFLLSCLAVSVLGFSLWNMPRAKIFMGDVGSGFLGGILGVIALYMGQFNVRYLWVWGILMGVFLVDASVTLLRRILRREKIWQAHCQHAYQHAAKALGSHAKVTARLFIINSLWLAPWAYIAWLGWCSPLMAMIIAYMPLLGLAWYWRAGCV